MTAQAHDTITGTTTPAARAARRANAGTVRLSQRDIDGLLLTGEHYGAPRPARRGPRPAVQHQHDWLTGSRPDPLVGQPEPVDRCLLAHEHQYLYRWSRAAA
jgi:hypothetical protein